MSFKKSHDVKLDQGQQTTFRMHSTNKTWQWIKGTHLPYKEPCRAFPITKRCLVNASHATVRNEYLNTRYSSVTSKFCFRISWFATYSPGWTSWNFRKLSATFSHTLSILKFCYDSNSSLASWFSSGQDRFYSYLSRRTSWRGFFSYTTVRANHTLLHNTTSR